MRWWNFPLAASRDANYEHQRNKNNKIKYCLYLYCFDKMIIILPSWTIVKTATCSVKKLYIIYKFEFEYWNYILLACHVLCKFVYWVPMGQTDMYIDKIQIDKFQTSFWNIVLNVNNYLVIVQYKVLKWNISVIWNWLILFERCRKCVLSITEGWKINPSKTLVVNKISKLTSFLTSCKNAAAFLFFDSTLKSLFVVIVFKTFSIWKHGENFHMWEKIINVTIFISLNRLKFIAKNIFLIENSKK